MRYLNFYATAPTGHMLRYFLRPPVFCDFHRNMRRQVANAAKTCYSRIGKNAPTVFGGGEKKQ